MGDYNPNENNNTESNNQNAGQSENQQNQYQYQQNNPEQQQQYQQQQYQQQQYQQQQYQQQQNQYQQNQYQQPHHQQPQYSGQSDYNQYNQNQYQYNGQNQYEQNPYNQYQPYQNQDTGMAIGALVCGIVSLLVSCCIPGVNFAVGIVGIILGILVIKNNRGGRTMAIIGLVLSALGVLSGIITIIGCAILANNRSFWENIIYEIESTYY